MSISVLTGDNGILEQAANAKEATDEASELESVTLAVNGAIMTSDNFVVEESLLSSELANYFENYNVSGDSDSGFTVTIGVKRYVVTASGNITKIGDVWYEDSTAAEYYISSAFQLCELSDIVNSGTDTFENKTVYLTSDIDMTEAYNAGYEFASIGNDTYNFDGIFDGTSHTISNFNNPQNYLGSSMFTILAGGTIQNLTIYNSTFESSKYYAAAFVSVSGTEGQSEPTYFYNCISLNNEITGTGTSSNSGGIIGTGSAGTQIINCFNNSTVSGKLSIGGIVGCQIDSGDLIIKNCCNAGNISGSNAGGLVGQTVSLESTTVTIIGSYNAGNISGTIVGGIVGNEYSTLTLKSSYNSGELTGTTLGGLIGESFLYKNSTPIIQNSYSITYDLIGSLDLTDAYSGNDSVTYYNSEGNLTEANMKSSEMITKLNNDLDTENYSYYIQDANNINDGYPILSWQQ